MNNLTMLHKQIRVAKFNKNLARSLAEHDLLLDDPKKRNQQRVSELSHLNTYRFKGQIITSEAERLEALEYIKSLYENDNNQFDSRTFSQQKHKLKKWIDANNTSPEEQKLFTKILAGIEKKPAATVNIDKALEQLSACGKVKRFNDKQKAIRSLLELHNQRKDLNVDQTSQLKTATISVLFKIPGHNKHDVTAEQQEQLINSYYKQNFADYEVLLSIVHNDEAIPHVHLTIDGKNSRTQQHDFVQRQYEYIKEKADLSAFPELYSQLDAQQLVEVGEHLQDDFYSFTNRFLQENGSKATFAKKVYESAEHKAIERAEIKKDTSKRIADREYNTANYYAEQKKKNIKRAMEAGLKAEAAESREIQANNRTQSAIEKLLDFAQAYAVNLLNSPLKRLRDAITGVYEIDKNIADKTVDLATELQQEEKKQQEIKDIYSDIKSKNKIKNRNH
ncbi:hypothetical protein KUL156_62630 [Alteromonas sp. KUL156]|nr:hypothetical protein KUL156_62630 [Alteromonas sp. KUL156]